MNLIDQSLAHAWHKVALICRDDPAEAARRLRRMQSATFSRPPRAWCLCIRASDTRISPHSAIIDLAPEARLYSADDTLENAIRRGEAHTVTLTGRLIRQLTRPVFIPWPGIDWKLAAARCGLTKDAFANWLRPTRSNPAPGNRWHGGNCRFTIEYRANARTMGGSRRGKPIPIVHTPSAIDPNNFQGRPPDGVWGSLWQWLWEKMPEEFIQTIPRTARVIDCRSRRNERYRGFRGFNWICPGRIGFNGEHIGCGAICRHLYSPMPIWTLIEAMGIDSDQLSAVSDQRGPAIVNLDSDQLSAVSDQGDGCHGRAGRAVNDRQAVSSDQLSAVSDQRGAAIVNPGSDQLSAVSDQRGPSLVIRHSSLATCTVPGVAGQGKRSFACARCWRILDTTVSNQAGWNHFVSYISGGLLYGREVKRPLSEAPRQRKRPEYRKVRRGRAAGFDDLSPQMQRLANLQLRGLPNREIARRLSIGEGTLGAYIQVMYRRLGVHNRVQLSLKLGRALKVAGPRHPKSPEVIARRRKVKRMLAEGLWQREIARRLGVHYQSVYEDVKWLRGQGNSLSSWERARVRVGPAHVKPQASSRKPVLGFVGRATDTRSAER